MKELLAIQQELKCPKNQFNSFGNYKYRNAEDILEALKPLLLKNNCTLKTTYRVEYVGAPTQVPHPVQPQQSLNGPPVPAIVVPSTFRYYMVATVKLTALENTVSSNELECEGWAQEPDKQGGMHAPQISGAASSYAKKYALDALFLLDDTKDSDGLNKHGQESQQQQPAQQQQRQPMQQRPVQQPRIQPQQQPGLIPPNQQQQQPQIYNQNPHQQRQPMQQQQQRPQASPAALLKQDMRAN